MFEIYQRPRRPELDSPGEKVHDYGRIRSTGRSAVEVAALRRFGRPTGPGGLGSADEGYAQKGGGPVDCDKRGLVEVASR